MIVNRFTSLRLTLLFPILYFFTFESDDRNIAELYAALSDFVKNYRPMNTLVIDDGDEPFSIKNIKVRILLWQLLISSIEPENLSDRLK